MVVGGEVVTLKNIEESTGIVMQEMPMEVSLFANSPNLLDCISIECNSSLLVSTFSTVLYLLLKICMFNILQILDIL